MFLSRFELLRAPANEGGSGITPSASTPASPTSAAPAAAPVEGAPATTPPSAPSGTPAPSTSPASSPVPSESGAVDGDGAGLFFDAMFTPTEAAEAGGTPPEPEAPTPAPVIPPVQEAAPAAPSQPTAPEAAAAAARPVEERGPQEVSPPLSPAEPASIARAIKENEVAAIEHLAATEFALRPEEVEALENDAVSVIPKLLAKAYVKAQHTMLMHLSRSVPLMIQNHLEVSRRNSANSDKFYAKWTNLKSGVHGELVNRIAQTYRGANPKASIDQMIEDVGTMVSQLAKVAPPAPVTTSVPSAVLNGGRSPQPLPFQPAVGGPVASSSQAEENPWDVLGRNE